jgi:prepilin-type N-terminal cleavage/methylation domain-containing protein
MLRTGNKGFTFVEVMVATAVLALVTVLIYESLFASLNLFNYYTDYLNLTPWADEKIWQAQDNLRRLGPSAQLDGGGEFVAANKRFNWNLSYGLLDEAQGLYKIDLAIFLKRGERRLKLIRAAYAKYEKE